MSRLRFEFSIADATMMAVAAGFVHARAVRRICCECHVALFGQLKRLRPPYDCLRVAYQFSFYDFSQLA